MPINDERSKWLPDFFWLGPQKSASTWAYHCFLEHPEIYVPGYENNLSGVGGDALHYFTIHYEKGRTWYKQFYDDYSGEKFSGDTTPSYLRSERAAKRIAEEIPDAKLIVCLRNPINRAYSHFWHEKKKEVIDYEFDQVLENYDLFQTWIVPGFYYEQIKTYLKYFSQDQLLILFHEDLKKSNKQFIQTVYEFLGVDSSFEPSILGERINPAGYRQTSLYKGYQRSVGLLERLNIKKNFEIIKKIPGFETAKDWVFGLSDYEQGMKSSTREQLVEIFREPNEKLSDFTNRDFNHWNR